MPGRLVRRETYDAEYARAGAEGRRAVLARWRFSKDLVFAGLLVLAVVACAAIFGPFGPSGEPDPDDHPDRAAAGLLLPLDLFGRGAAAPLRWRRLRAARRDRSSASSPCSRCPWSAGEGEKSWRRRPVAVLTVILAGVAWGTLTHLGNTSPWSPVMDAWSALPVPRSSSARRRPCERQGALVFQLKQCRNCHALGDQGGRRGPALDDVATRLTHDQLIRQVLQGGGNMPAYGTNLSPAETTALVALPRDAPARARSAGAGRFGQRSRPPRRDALGAPCRARPPRSWLRGGASGPDRAARRGGARLPARLAQALPAAIGPLPGLAAAPRFSAASRPSGSPRFAARRLLEPAADGAHGAAPHADGRRAAAAPARFALLADPAGLASVVRPRRPRSVPRLAARRSVSAGR